MNDSLIYAVQSLPWITAGLLVGFFIGRATVAVEVVTDAVQPEGDEMRDSKKRPKISSNMVIAAVLVALGLATAVQSYVHSEATARLTACQTAYANGFADALDARSKASAEAQEALDTWMATLNSVIQAPSADAREKIRKAFQDYLEARRDAKETQRDHPYPPAPRDVCKEK